MAFVDSHFWASAACAAVPCAALGAPPELVVSAALVAGYFGAKADLDGFIAGLKDLPKNRFNFRKSYRWDIYEKLHKAPPLWLRLNPFFMLHLWVDKSFHDASKPGWNWWPEKWKLDVAIRLIGMGAVWAAYISS
jgi:hypothetical protein